MTKPSEYLAAATIMAIRAVKAGDVPKDRAQLNAILERRYNIDVFGDSMQLLLKQLADWNMVTFLDDQYAGETLYLEGTRSDELWDKAGAEILDKAWQGGFEWLRKIFDNPLFWENLETQHSDGDNILKLSTELPIPAADRIVTLSHNQYSEISKPADQLISKLEEDNGGQVDPDFRQRIIGQIKAGRELVRAGVMEIGLFRVTMIAGLRLIAEKYEGHAIGAAASALLTLILHELGMPGF